MMIFPLVAGCLPQAKPTTDPGIFYTEAAKTIVVAYTMNAINATLFAPTATMEPATETPEPSATPESPTLEPSAMETVILDFPTEILPSATPTETATPDTRAMIMASQNTNCRTGPGGVYPTQNNGLVVGKRVPVYGRLSTNTWWLIQDPDDETKKCWVWSQTTSVDGDLNTIPIIPMPTLPPAYVEKFNIYGWATPATYSGECPVKLTLNGSISTNIIGDVTYRFTSSVDGISTGWMDDTFKVKDKHAYSATFTITQDTKGVFRFRTTFPFEEKTDQIPFEINCE